MKACLTIGLNTQTLLYGCLNCNGLFSCVKIVAMCRDEYKQFGVREFKVYSLFVYVIGV